MSSENIVQAAPPLLPIERNPLGLRPVMEKNALSGRVNALEESQTIGMAKMSRDLIAKGINVISLSLGEPDFITPDHIRNAAKKAIDDGYTHYAPIAGFIELRKAISAKFKRENNLDYN